MRSKYRFKGHVNSVNDLPLIDGKTVKSGDLYSVGCDNRVWAVDYNNPPRYVLTHDEYATEIINNAVCCSNTIGRKSESSTLDTNITTFSETFKQALQLMTYICAIAAQVDAYQKRVFAVAGVISFQEQRSIVHSKEWRHTFLM